MDQDELILRILTHEYALRGLASMMRDLMLKSGLKMDWVRILQEIEAQAEALSRDPGGNVVRLQTPQDLALAEAMRRAKALLSKPLA